MALKRSHKRAVVDPVIRLKVASVDTRTTISGLHFWHISVAICLHLSLKIQKPSNFKRVEEWWCSVLFFLSSSGPVLHGCSHISHWILHQWSRRTAVQVAQQHRCWFFLRTFCSVYFLYNSRTALCRKGVLTWLTDSTVVAKLEKKNPVRVWKHFLKMHTLEWGYETLVFPQFSLL